MITSRTHCRTFRSSFAAAGLLLSGLWSASASATTLISLDTTDLAHVSDVIVVAEVQDVRFSEEGTPATGGRTVLTHNRAKVVETWKGNVAIGETVDVIEPGGIAGLRSFDVIGTAGYLKNERVVLFLQQRKFGGYLTIGMFQGKFTLVKSGQTYRLTRVKVPMSERGHAFDAAKVSVVTPEGVGDYAAFEATVKRVVQADQQAGIKGIDLPKYKGMGR